MATRSTAVVGETLELRAAFSTGGVPFDPVSITKVELLDVELNVVQTVTDTTRISEGVYEVEFEPVEVAGPYADRWYYTIVDGGTVYSRGLEFTVSPMLVEPGEAPPEDPPDTGSGTTCDVTATFFDASGRARRGVVVQFSPAYSANRPIGAVAVPWTPVSAESDADGVLRLRLLRGIEGTITCSGMLICRQITVPDTDTVELGDLIAAADDPLVVQQPRPRYTLPRTT